MISIQQDVSLQAYNTFGLDTKAHYFVSVKTVEELKEALKSDYHPKFILGGGSNMLLKSDIKALVIHIAIKGIKVVKKSINTIWVQAQAGENWHHFVLFCLEHNYGGLENLSLIPGNVGTAPIQNIGAYGVELKDVFEECSVIDRNTLEEKILKLKDCNFGYRDSIFKNTKKGKYVITSVTFKLSKKEHHIHTSYGAIQTMLDKKGITNPTIKDVSNAVIHIRQEKLPNPKEIGNSGSFFKNPIVSLKVKDKLLEEFPDLPFYPIDNNNVKLPAGWLIEHAGLKGKRFGEAGIHNKQALVLVNYGKATGEDIWNVALKVIDTVKEKFDITLQPEVNIIE